ncbi:MAG: hypothetical protein PHT02_11115 [Tissierellia bacterium]|nr:hypothetical protein [Tissierellia bacterium]
MQLTHQPLIYLFKNILDEDIQKCIEIFILSVIEMKENYKTDNLWIADQKIGGIGAYAMPPNPVINPFPVGIERSLYRPLQYARADINICDIRTTARYIIQSCGIHLECVCRLVLSTYKTSSNLRYHNTTLGKAIQLIKGLNAIESNNIVALEGFVKIYNLSKHEINQDENRERLFNAYEAIATYYSARILGVHLLRKINYPKSSDTFEINNDERPFLFK